MEMYIFEDVNAFFEQLFEEDYFNRVFKHNQTAEFVPQ